MNKALPLYYNILYINSQIWRFHLIFSNPSQLIFHFISSNSTQPEQVKEALAHPCRAEQDLLPVYLADKRPNNTVIIILFYIVIIIISYYFIKIKFGDKKRIGDYSPILLLTNPSQLGNRQSSHQQTCLSYPWSFQDYPMSYRRTDQPWQQLPQS